MISDVDLANKEWSPAYPMWGRRTDPYIRFMKYQKDCAKFWADWCVSALESGDIDTAEICADQSTRYNWNYYAALDLIAQEKTICDAS